MERPLRRVIRLFAGVLVATSMSASGFAQTRLAGQRVRLELDALNALNTNVAWGRGVPGISFASGPTFGYATQIVAPRIIRFGVTYRF